MDFPAEVVFKVLYKKHCPYTNKCSYYETLTKSKPKDIVCEKGYKIYKECELYKNFREK